MTDRESRIRERAYQLWIEKGQPDGRADHHWEEACRLVDQEDGKAEGPGNAPVAAGEAADAKAARSRSVGTGAGSRRRQGHRA